MIYSNVALTKESKEMDFGTLYRFVLGGMNAQGRGRKAVYLTCWPDSEDIKVGKNSDISLGKTRTGKTRIVKDDGCTYILIDSYHDYSRRGCGCVKIDKPEAVEILERGNGADGIAGRIGRWPLFALKVKEDCIIKIVYSGAYRDSGYIAVANGKVYAAECNECLDMLDTIGVDMPTEWAYL